MNTKSLIDDNKRFKRLEIRQSIKKLKLNIKNQVLIDLKMIRGLSFCRCGFTSFFMLFKSQRGYIGFLIIWSNKSHFPIKRLLRNILREKGIEKNILIVAEKYSVTYEGVGYL